MKPGYKTTEMWSAGTVAVIIGNTMEASTDWRVLCTGCAALAVIAAAYMFSRTAQKKVATGEAK